MSIYRDLGITDHGLLPSLTSVITSGSSNRDYRIAAQVRVANILALLLVLLPLGGMMGFCMPSSALLRLKAKLMLFFLSVVVF